MSQETNKRSVVVGAFILLGVVILVAGVLFLGGQQKRFVKSVQVKAIFDDVSGLKAGDNVWFSGVKIGTVKRIHFYGSSQVEVDLNIEEKSQSYIRKDAGCQIGSDGLIGNKIVLIIGGTQRVAAVQEGDRLRTLAAFSSEQLLDTLQTTNRNLLKITTDVKSIVSQVKGGKGIAGAVLNDQALVGRFQSVVSNLQAAAINANRLSGTLSKFSAKLNTKGTLAHELVNDTAVFANLKESSRELKRAASSAVSVADNAKRASDKLNSTDNALGVLLNDPSVNKNLKNTVQNLESSSKKLDEDLEAAQHNFLLRGFFRRKAKDEAKQKKDSLR